MIQIIPAAFFFAADHDPDHPRRLPQGAKDDPNHPNRLPLAARMIQVLQRVEKVREEPKVQGGGAQQPTGCEHRQRSNLGPQRAFTTRC
jgi:hypothetical protein